jgi:hypothetical protein
MDGFKLNRGLAFFALFLAAGALWGTDTRTGPLDMYIIVDGSSALAAGKDAALGWLCDYAVDELLREGDRLTIWVAAGSAERIFSESLTGAETKEAAKAKIRAISPRGTAADYLGALREAAGMEAAAGNRRTPYTILLSGSTAGPNPFPGGSAAAGMLR